MRMKLVIVLIILFCSLLTSTVLYILERREFSEIKNQDVVETYKYFELDTNKNLKTSGFVDLPRGSIDDFVSYELESGVHAVISEEFKTLEYQCSGTCYCEEDENLSNERRSKNAIVKSSISFLVASISSLLVYDKARDMLSNGRVCEDHFTKSTTCSSPNSVVRSTVDECVSISSIHLDDEDDEFIEDYETEKSEEADPEDLERLEEMLRMNDRHKQEDYEEETSKDERKKLIGSFYWRCSGHCYRNPNLKRREPIEASEFFNCGKLTTTGLSHAWPKEDTLDYIDFAQPYEDLLEQEMNEVLKNFHLYYLRPFCRENSLERIRVFRDPDKAKPEDQTVDPEKGSVFAYYLCSASYESDSKTNRVNVNPSIQCVRTEDKLQKGKYFHHFYSEDHEKNQKDVKM